MFIVAEDTHNYTDTVLGTQDASGSPPRARTRSASDGTTVGSYNLSIDCLNPTSGEDRTLTVGTLQTGMLGAAAEVDLYTFTATAGDVISLTGVQTAGFSPYVARFSLFDATGAFIDNIFTNNRRLYTLPSDGTYTVMVDANNVAATGDYALVVETLFPPRVVTSTLVLGVAGRGDLTGTAQLNVHEIGLTTGSQHTVSISDVSGLDPGNALVSVYTPSRAFVGSTANGSFSFTATVTGTYYLVVGADNFFATGSYSLTVTSP